MKYEAVISGLAFLVVVLDISGIDPYIGVLILVGMFAIAGLIAAILGVRDAVNKRGND